MHSPVLSRSLYFYSWEGRAHAPSEEDWAPVQDRFPRMCSYAQFVCRHTFTSTSVPHRSAADSTWLTGFCFVAPVTTAEEERAEARRKFDENRKKHYNMRAVLQAHDDDEGEEVRSLSSTIYFHKTRKLATFYLSL